MTERPAARGTDATDPADLADPGAKRDPAEGGRDEVAGLPGADTANPTGDEPTEEADQGQ